MKRQEFRSVRSSRIPGVVQIFPEINIDWRGENVEVYRQDKHCTEEVLGKDVSFIQDNMNISSRDTLRGLHGDYITDKLVSCVFGRIYLVVVDQRIGSVTFGEWESFVLEETTKCQVFIPKGMLNGHLCLSDRCIFTYKTTAYFTKVEDQITRKWNDPEFSIWWPISNPRLSERDDCAKSNVS